MRVGFLYFNTMLFLIIKTPGTMASPEQSATDAAALLSTASSALDSAIPGPAVIGPASPRKDKLPLSGSSGSQPLPESALVSAAYKSPSSDFPHQFRRLSKHLTALQSRSGPPILLFEHPPATDATPAPPPAAFPPLHDPYDLRAYPGKIPLRPDLLSTNVERLIVAAAPIYGGLVREIKRLAKWKNPKRTGAWLAIYSTAWALKFVLPLALAIVIWLCVDPKKAVTVLFPQEPKSRSRPRSRSRSKSPEKSDEREEGEVDTPGDEAASEASSTSDGADDPPTPGRWNEDSKLEKGAEALGEQLATYVASSGVHGYASARPTAGGPVPDPAAGSPLDALHSRFKPPTDPGPSLADTYAPQVVKYGTSVQNVSGRLADAHERWRNIFLERTCPPPGSKEAAERFPPNVRFALPIVPILLASICLSTEAFARLVTFVLGFLFFFLSPLSRASKSVKHALEEDRTVLRGAPTDRAWVMAVAREICRREGIDAAMALLQWPADPTKQPQEKSGVAGAEAGPDHELAAKEAVEGSSAVVEESPAPVRIRKRDRLSMIMRKAMEASETSHALLTGQRTISLSDIAGALLPVPTGAQASASYSSSATRDRVLGLLAPARPTGKEHEGAASVSMLNSSKSRQELML